MVNKQVLQKLSSRCEQPTGQGYVVMTTEYPVKKMLLITLNGKTGVTDNAPCLDQLGWPLSQSLGDSNNAFWFYPSSIWSPPSSVLGGWLLKNRGKEEVEGGLYVFLTPCSSAMSLGVAGFLQYQRSPCRSLREIPQGPRKPAVRAAGLASEKNAVPVMR